MGYRGDRLVDTDADAVVALAIAEHEKRQP
jgi:hypothetical protein